MIQLSPIESVLAITLVISGLLFLFGALIRLSELIEEFFRLRRIRRNTMMATLKNRRSGK